MQRLILGFGNTLRGEDAFGVDAITLLQKETLENTTLQSAFGLTPEMALDLLAYSHIVFIDTAFSSCHAYTLACSLENSKEVSLSHHISVFHLMDILNTLYQHYPTFEIFSMLGNNFETISNKIAYHEALEKTTQFLMHY